MNTTQNFMFVYKSMEMYMNPAFLWEKSFLDLQRLADTLQPCNSTQKKKNPTHLSWEARLLESLADLSAFRVTSTKQNKTFILRFGLAPISNDNAEEHATAVV